MAVAQCVKRHIRSEHLSIMKLQVKVISVEMLVIIQTDTDDDKNLGQRLPVSHSGVPASVI